MEKAIISRQTILYSSLEDLVHAHTSIHILQALEEHLTQFLAIPTKNKFNPTTSNADTSLHIRRAIQHQNIIGWENFTRGYISNKWAKIQQSMTTTDIKYRKRNDWNTTLVKTVLSLHQKIWQHRNQDIHGNTIAEARALARQNICQWVHDLYKHPPRLAKRYPPITNIPIEQRLRKTTQQLTDWLTRVDHQQKVTKWMETTRPPGQLSIQEAFRNMRRHGNEKQKYPP